jgi:hypothetical protein
MSMLELLLLLLVAALIGAVGQAIAGYSRGGCLVSIALGFIGAHRDLAGACDGPARSLHVLGGWHGLSHHLVHSGRGPLRGDHQHAQPAASLRGDPPETWAQGRKKPSPRNLADACPPVGQPPRARRRSSPRFR